MYARALVLLPILALAACGESPRIVEPVPQSLALARSSAAPVHMVSLGGKLDLSAFNLPDETYAMTAQRDANGNVSGNFMAKLSDPVVSFLSLIHIPSPRDGLLSRMPSSA